MSPEEFSAYAKRLGPSRLKFCEKIGIGERTGDEYALGRRPVPLTVALAIAALNHGLEPAGAEKKPTACGLPS